MLLLLAALAAASDAPSETSAAPAPTTPASAPEVARTPSGRAYHGVVDIPAQVVAPAVGPFTPEQRVANVSGVVMDRFGVIREIRGAAPVLYVDGMRVIGTGPRR